MDTILGREPDRLFTRSQCSRPPHGSRPAGETSQVTTGEHGRYPLQKSHVRYTDGLSNSCERDSFSSHVTVQERMKGEQ